MSSGGGKLEKLPDLSPETEKIIATLQFVARKKRADEP